MSRLGKHTPAFLRRAFFVGVAVATAHAAAPGPNRPPELAQVGLPDAGEAKEIIDQVRRAGIPGQYFLEFQLRVLPRRGAETTYRGRWWGGRNAQGAITRVELTDGEGKVHRLLVQNGEKPAVWRWSGGSVSEVGAAALAEPVIPGVEVSAFDLQMPFLFWPDVTVEGLRRGFRGRPANVFLFKAPASYGGITAVRAYFDTQFNAIIQTETLGGNGRLLKTMSLMDLKKVTDPQTKAERYIPKSFDVRNDQTRDKTRFQVTGAALDLELVPAVFEPASLAEPIQSPAAGRIVRIEP